ncbi:MAG: choice-of-anchor tandem repeat NxxGxxAF-containing protein [Phycisphaerales bacterium JB041]
MVNLRAVFAWCLAVVLVAAAAPGQCLDWVDGYSDDGLGPDQAVTAVASGMLDGEPAVLVGGFFERIGGVPCKGLATWDGSDWTPFDQWYDGWVSAMVWADDGGGPALFVIGAFYLTENAPRSSVLRWRNGQWEDLGADIGNDNPRAIVEHDGALYLVGGFLEINGQPTRGLASWDGASWSAYPDVTNGQIYAAASYTDQNGPALVIGGFFSEAGGVFAENVAMLRDGVWSGMGGGLRVGSCRTLRVVNELGGPTLYAGGDFQFTGPSERVRNLARWDGAAWRRIGGSTNDGGEFGGRVVSLGVLPGQFWNELVVAGNFDEGNGLRGVAVWNRFDNEMRTLRGGLGVQDAYVAEAVQTPEGQRLLIGGSLYDQGGKPADHLAIWGVPCSPPRFVSVPASRKAPFDEGIVFNVETHGSLPMEYAWFHNGELIENGGRFQGADTDWLNFWPWWFADRGVYECVATNDIGQTVSEPIELTMPGENLPSFPIETLTLLDDLESPVDPNRTIGILPRSVARDGAVAARAGGGGAEEYVVSIDGAGVSYIVARGDPFPGSDEEFIGRQVGVPIALGGGSVVFAARIEGPNVEPASDSAILFYDGVSLRVVVREGDPAPHVGQEAVIADFDSGLKLRGAADGEVIVTAPLGGGPFEPNDDSGVWRWSSTGEFALLGHSGQEAPGGDAHWTFLTGEVDSGSPGRGVLSGWLDSATGYKNTYSNDHGLWIESGAGLERLAVSGDHAPGFAPDVNFESFAYPVGSGGLSWFSSRVAGPDAYSASGVWSTTGGEPVPVTLSGDPVPVGPPDAPDGATMGLCSLLRANGRGALVIRSRIETDCGNQCASHGLFVASPGGELRPAGYNRAPGLPGMDEELSIASITSALLNDRNQIVIEAGVEPSIGLGGVLGWVPLRGMFPIVVPGTRIETEPGLIRVVESATLVRSRTPDDETACGLDESGNLTLTVAFSDRRDALIRLAWTDARNASFPCRADVNLDGAVDTRDVVAFLNLWSARGWGADFTDDGVFDTRDVVAFLNSWTEGCG